MWDMIVSRLDDLTFDDVTQGDTGDVLSWNRKLISIVSLSTASS